MRSNIRYTYFLATDDRLLHVESKFLTRKPRRGQVDLTSREKVSMLVERMLAVRDATSLLGYVKEFGSPDFRLHTDRKGNRSPAPVEHYLQRAATLRWLSKLINAQSEQDRETIDTFVNARYVRNGSLEAGGVRFNIDHTVILKLICPQAHSLYSDYQRCSIFLGGNDRDYVVSKSEWDRKRFQCQLRFIREMIAFHINSLTADVRSIINPIGLYEELTLDEQFDAMIWFLRNQFLGGSGVLVCRNPNCPQGFYVPKPGKRATRSDRKYCGRAGCQRYCYDHKDRGLGPLRHKTG